jgi:hypothetical protein
MLKKEAHLKATETVPPRVVLKAPDGLASRWVESGVFAFNFSNSGHSAFLYSFHQSTQPAALCAKKLS